MTFTRQLFKAAMRLSLIGGLLWPSALAAQAAGTDDVLIIGRKGGMEQQLVTLMSQCVLFDAGIPVRSSAAMETAGIRRAIRQGDVGLYWEYTGTALSVFNRQRENLPIDQQLASLRNHDSRNGITWLTPSRIDNSFVILMREERAAGFDINTLSDLAEIVREGWKLSVGVHNEFYSRPDGLKPLQTAYDFKLTDNMISRHDGQSPLLPVLLDGKVDAIITDRNTVIPTDYDIRVIEDDRGFFPAYILTPVVRADVLERWPGIDALLSHLARELDNRTVTELLAAASDESTSLLEVAERFLMENNLMRSREN